MECISKKRVGKLKPGLLAANYDKASKYLYDQNNILKVEKAHQQLKEAEVYFTDYRDLKIEEDDGWKCNHYPGSRSKKERLPRLYQF